MTNEEYRAAEGVSRSELFRLTVSPLHFRYEQEHPKSKTPALQFGSAFHKLVLEPDTFSQEFAVLSICDRRTKEGKALFAEFEENCGDKAVVTAEEYEQICSMRDSVMGNPYARLLLRGEVEQSFFWDDELTGERCKCRPDVLTEVDGDGIIVDLKSCVAADSDSFMRDCVKYGYDLQVAMYRQGVYANTGKWCEFVFIAVEKEPPYAVNLLQANDLVIRRGEDLFRELIGKYHHCKTTGNWYGYNGFSGMINNLSLPRWMEKEYE
mgnify:CR=1 FL=1